MLKIIAHMSVRGQLGGQTQLLMEEEPGGVSALKQTYI